MNNQEAYEILMKCIEQVENMSADDVKQLKYQKGTYGKVYNECDYFSDMILGSTSMLMKENMKTVTIYMDEIETNYKLNSYQESKRIIKDTNENIVSAA
ncbi:MAG: hypothetical protein E7231_03295 [Cellulosilyticum sp.]|nr:hypothetical protein [Cellulosilyticum sp.]